MTMDIFKEKVWLKEKIAFFRLLAVSQKAGLAVRDSLLAIRHSEKNSTMVEILTSLINNLSSGMEFSKAMEIHSDFFSRGEIELVKSAQMTGNLVGTLNDIFLELQTSAEINQKIKKAMTYPIILLSFSVIAIIALVTYAIPNIVSLFPPEAIPPVTQFVLEIWDFMKTRWYWLFWGVAVIVIWFKILYRTMFAFRVFLDNLFLKLPAVSDVVKNYYMYKFSKLLGQFYKAWLNPVVSLGLIWSILSNVNYKKKIFQVKEDIESWFTFFDSLEWSPLFDPILTQIIHVGEETGTTGDVMNNISTFYEDELKSKIDVMVSLVEPLIISLVAGVIGMVMASVFLPMTEIVNQIWG